MELERIEEFQIAEATHLAIQQLLEEAFSGYPEGRSFFKQLPDFRYLLWQGDQLAAHMAVEHRLINNADQLLHIFGVADLCVAASFQQRKLASRLLEELTQLGKQHRIDFLVLQANEAKLYENNGFQPQENLCQWLLITQNKTLGVARRRIEHSLMVKPLGDKIWKPGLVDFLGHVF